MINNIHGFQETELIRSNSLCVLFAAYFLIAVFIFWVCCLLTLNNYHVASFSFMRQCSCTEYQSLSPTYWGTKLGTCSWILSWKIHMKSMIAWKRYPHLDDEQATWGKWQLWTVVSFAWINILSTFIVLGESHWACRHMTLGMCPCQRTNWLNCNLNK